MVLVKLKRPDGAVNGFAYGPNDLKCFAVIGWKASGTVSHFYRSKSAWRTCRLTGKALTKSSRRSLAASVASCVISNEAPARTGANNLGQTVVEACGDAVKGKDGQWRSAKACGMQNQFTAKCMQHSALLPHEFGYYELPPNTALAICAERKINKLNDNCMCNGRTSPAEKTPLFGSSCQSYPGLGEGFAKPWCYVNKETCVGAKLHKGTPDDSGLCVAPGQLHGTGGLFKMRCIQTKYELFVVVFSRIHS